MSLSRPAGPRRVPPAVTAPPSAKATGSVRQLPQRCYPLKHLPDARLKHLFSGLLKLHDLRITYLRAPQGCLRSSVRRSRKRDRRLGLLKPLGYTRILQLTSSRHSDYSLVKEPFRISVPLRSRLLACVHRLVGRTLYRSVRVCQLRFFVSSASSPRHGGPNNLPTFRRLSTASRGQRCRPRVQWVEHHIRPVVTVNRDFRFASSTVTTKRPSPATSKLQRVIAVA